MQYPLLTLVSLLELVSGIFFGILIIYFLVKMFDRTVQFSKFPPAVLMYFVTSALIYLILALILPRFDPFSTLIKLTIGIAVNFFAFKIILKKYFDLNLGKILLIYMLTLILLPTLYFLLFMLASQILTQPLFAAEMEQFQQQLFTPEPLIFRIITVINHGIFTAPAVYLKNVLVTTPNIFNL